MAEKDSKIKRSTSYPRIDLNESVNDALSLYEKHGDVPFTREIAARALGYKGISGASASKLASIAHYGLVKSSGGSYQATELLKSIKYPRDEEEKKLSIIKAVKTPVIFKHIFDTYGGKPLPTMLANNLFRNEKFKLTDNSSKKVVSIFKKSANHASLLVNGILVQTPVKKEEDKNDNLEDENKRTNVTSPTFKPADLKEGTSSDKKKKFELSSGIEVAFPKPFEESVAFGDFGDELKAIQHKAEDILKQINEKKNKIKP